jgi:GxxExxY protein
MLDELVRERVIASAIAVHREIGPGMPQALYVDCLALELEHHGLRFASRMVLPVLYRGRVLDYQYNIDFLVEDMVVVVVRTLESIRPSHMAELAAQIRHSGRRLGLLFNFHAPILKLGLRQRALTGKELM